MRGRECALEPSLCILRCPRGSPLSSLGIAVKSSLRERKPERVAAEGPGEDKRSDVRIHFRRKKQAATLLPDGSSPCSDRTRRSTGEATFFRSEERRLVRTLAGVETFRIGRGPRELVLAHLRREQSRYREHTLDHQSRY